MPAPVVNELPTSIEAVEGAAPIVIGATIKFKAAAGIANGSLTVSGLVDGDRVAIGGSTGLTVSGSTLLDGTRVVGTVEGGVDTAPVVVHFAAGALTGDAQRILQALTYRSVSDAPQTNHTLTIDAVDANGERLGDQPTAMPSFELATTALTGVTARSTAFFDADGDGDLDVGFQNTNSYKYLLTNQGGTYVEAAAVNDPFSAIFSKSPVTISPPAMADLNADGHLDLVTFSGILTYELRVYFGDASGIPNVSTKLGSTTLWDQHALGDVDGDGDIDIVHRTGTTGSGTTQWLENDGQGVFTAGDSTVFAGVMENGYLALGDIDGDGDLDLVVGTAGKVLTYRNDDGGHTLLADAANPFAGIDHGTSKLAPTLTDLDGDGDVDLVLADRTTNTISTYLNDSQGRATVGVHVTQTNDAPRLTGVTTVLAVVEGAAPVVIDSAVAFDDPDRNVGTGAVLTVAGLEAGDVVGLGALASEGVVRISGAIVGTVSGGNGAPLVVTFDGSAAVAAVDTVIQNLTFAAYAEHPGGPRTLSIDFVDGGGAHMAVPATVTVTVTPVNRASLVLSPSATFHENVVNAEPQRLDSHLVLVDKELQGATVTFSGLLAEDRLSVLWDGHVAVAGGTIRYDGDAIGTVTGGDGAPLVITFTDAVSDVAATAVLRNVAYANVSDVPTAERTIAVTLVDSDGAVLAARAPGFTQLLEDANPYEGIFDNVYPAPHDVDGDGDLDLLMVGTNSAPRILWNDDGVIGARSTAIDTSGAPGPPSDIRSFAFADLDGDGNDEIIATYTGQFGGLVNSRYSAVFAFDGTTLRFAQPLVAYGSNNLPVAATAGDIDGDGDVDLVFGSNGSELRVMRNDDGTFVKTDGFFAGFQFGDHTNAVTAGPRPTAGDVDGDGDIDIVVGSEHGYISYLRNDGGGNFVQPGRDNPFSAAQKFDFGTRANPLLVDVDADGDLDLVVTNDDGTIRTFRNDALNTAIKVTVIADADPAVANPDAARTTENAVATVDPLANDRITTGVGVITAIAGTALTAGGTVLLPSGAIVTLNAEGTLTYDPNGRFGTLVSEATGAATGARNTHAIDAFTYTLAGGSTATVTVTVDGIASAGDRIEGDANGNHLFGTGAADLIFGHDGDDWINGLGGADHMEGGTGNDFYVVNHFGDSVVEAAGGGSDTVFARVDYAADESEIERIIGRGDGGLTLSAGSVAARVAGGGGDDWLTGGAASDVLDGHAGADRMDGGAGDDRYMVDNAGDRVIEAAGDGFDRVRALVDFAAGGAEVEMIIAASDAGLWLSAGSVGARIRGGDGDDTLDGGIAADRITGGAGDDHFRASPGGDIWFGDAGSDTFILGTEATGSDAPRLRDFRTGTDLIGLDHTLFGDPAPGALDPAAFRLAAGGRAADADDRIIYGRSTGHLWFDGDGVGGDPAMCIAHFNPGTALDIADIYIF